MITKKEIMRYLLYTPENTNPSIVSQMLDEYQNMPSAHTYEQFTEKIAQGGDILLETNISNKSQINILNNTNLNLGESAITTSNNMRESNNNCLMRIKANVNVTIENGTMDALTGVKEWDPNLDSNPAIIVDEGAKLTIKDGIYYGGYVGIFVKKGECTILGGTFKCQDDPSCANQNYAINCNDANYKTGDAKIIVKGGKYIGFNPADCGCEGPHTNFVADGYKSVNRGEYWEVIPE